MTIGGVDLSLARFANEIGIPANSQHTLAANTVSPLNAFQPLKRRQGTKLCTLYRPRDLSHKVDFFPPQVN